MLEGQPQTAHGGECSVLTAASGQALPQPTLRHPVPAEMGPAAHSLALLWSGEDRGGQVDSVRKYEGGGGAGAVRL